MNDDSKRFAEDRVKYTSDKGAPEDRIRNRLRSSGIGDPGGANDAEPGQHTVKAGDGPTRTFTHVHTKGHVRDHGKAEGKAEGKGERG